MAAAAEVLNLQAIEFDWGLAEAQFAEEPIQIRPPEDEIYGRSLSTIQRLGAFMIDRTIAETVASPEAAQAKAEFITSVQEGFGTDMELGGGLVVRDFDVRPVIGGRVMSKDEKTAISAMTEAGLACAIATADNDVRFVPQLTRSEWDHKNALLVDEMARGETAYNTRIVVSLFPEEAAAQSGNEYWRNIGYVPHLKRGFVQMYYADGTSVVSGSLSFDGGDKERAREVFAQFGIAIPENESTDNWLKYAVTGNYTEEQAKQIATLIADKSGDPELNKTANTVDVTAQYQAVMERAFDEAYIHICESLARGRQTEEARNLIYRLTNRARDFNKHYANALYRMRANADQFVDEDSVVLHELLVYSTIEMMRALHLDNTSQNAQADEVYVGTNNNLLRLQMADAATFQNMLGGYGAEGAKNNRTYSACGLAISLGGSPDGNPQASFGGMDAKHENVGSDRFGSLQFSCPKCSKTNIREPGKLIPRCRHCGKDVSCGPKVDGHKQIRSRQVILKELLMSADDEDKTPSEKPADRNELKLAA